MPLPKTRQASANLSGRVNRRAEQARRDRGFPRAIIELAAGVVILLSNPVGRDLVGRSVPGGNRRVDCGLGGRLSQRLFEEREDDTAAIMRQGIGRCGNDRVNQAALITGVFGLILCRSSSERLVASDARFVHVSIERADDWNG